MPLPARFQFYIDFKSPYAYLARDPTRALARATGASIDWLPYILDIPAYLGSARVDDQGRVLEEARNAHQWRRVRYSYMDCRRQARKQGLTIRGTQKIWDSALAAAGMLHAKRHGPDALDDYVDAVFDRFWRRELDIENVAALAPLLPGGFAAEADALRAEVAHVSREAEAMGVFGVPTYVLDGEVFWGREHLEDIAAMLRA